MRGLLILVAVAALALLAAMQLGLIRLDQTQTAALPSVKIEGGQAPKFNADVAKVKAGTETKTVEVPTVSVQKPGEAPKQ